MMIHPVNPPAVFPRITWQSPLLGPSGYAEAGRNILQGIFRLGADVRCMPTWGETPLEIFETRTAPDLIEAEVDGHLRYIRLKTPVEAALRDRILAGTFRPAGGVHVALHPPADGGGRDYWRFFRSTSPAHRAWVGFTMFETDRVPDVWVSCMNLVDEVWVPTRFGRQVFEDSGVDPDRIRVVPLPADPELFHPGVPPLVVGRPAGFTFLSIFEWTHRKGWDLLIRAFLEEFDPGEDVRLLIRAYQGGGVTGKRRVPIPEQYDAFLRSRGLQESDRRRVEFIDRMVPAPEMPGLFRAADAFVLPTRGEGWGQPFAEALLSGVPVIATRWSGQMEFLDDDVASLVEIEGLVPVDEAQVMDNAFYAGHRWAEPSLPDLKRRMRQVFEAPEEARRKAQLGRERLAARINPEAVARTVLDACAALEASKRRRPRVPGAVSAGAPDGRPGPPADPAGAAASGAVSADPAEDAARPRRILFQARDTLFALPGGDTEVLLALKRGLEERGHVVDFSAHRGSAEGYDLAHVFNMDLGHALNLALQKVPFVMTPLFEDRAYLGPCYGVFRAFRDVLSVEPPDLGTLAGAPWSSPEDDAGRVSPEERLAARLPDRLLCVGRSEAERCRQELPGASVEVAPLGWGFEEDDGSAADPELFARAFGVRDHILCVGRLEMRKNQLMLLHALRDLEVPLVFVNSRTHHREYEELCRAYPRRAPTIFTGRISREMLRSAYAGAAVHVLPSFYELPGLVTLEAAARGAPVVASPSGALPDYLPRGVHWCRPDDPASIRAAVDAALRTGCDRGAVAAARSFTWDRAARELERRYEEVLAEAAAPGWKSGREARRELVSGELERRACLASAIGAIEERRHKDALALVAGVLEATPDDPTAWFVAGEAALKMGNYAAAREALARCHELNPRHGVRLYLFRALAEMGLGDARLAHRLLREGMDAWPLMNAKVEALFCDYLSRCAAGMGDRAGQVKWADRRLALQPGDPAAAFARAQLAAAEGDLARAVRVAADWWNRPADVDGDENAGGPGAGPAPDPKGARFAARPDSYRFLTLPGEPSRRVLVLGLSPGGRLGDLLARIPAATPVMAVDPEIEAALGALAMLPPARAAGRRPVQLVAGIDASGVVQFLEPLLRSGERLTLAGLSRRLDEQSEFFDPVLDALRQEPVAPKMSAGGA